LAIMLILVGWFETEHFEKSLSAKEIAHEVTKLIVAPSASVPTIPQTAPAPSSHPVPLPPLDVTPDYLMGLYRDRLAVQADKLAELYIGKRIEISGRLDEVSGPTSGPKDFNRDKMCVYLKNTINIIVLISLYFRITWNERLEVMQKNQKISAICEISSIRSVSLELDNCDLRD
jgi:hypothetical protein